MNLGLASVPMNGSGGVLGRLTKPLEAIHFGLIANLTRWALLPKAQQPGTDFSAGLNKFKTIME